jgi:hypothetical protein
VRRTVGQCIEGTEFGSEVLQGEKFVATFETYIWSHKSDTQYFTHKNHNLI